MVIITYFISQDISKEYKAVATSKKVKKVAEKKLNQLGKKAIVAKAA